MPELDDRAPGAPAPAVVVGADATALTTAPSGELDAPTGEAALGLDYGLAPASRSQWAYARRRFMRHRLAMVSFVVLVIILTAGALAKWIAPYPFEVQDFAHSGQAPSLEAKHFFGTDVLGRDYFSRVLYGIQTSEKVAFITAILATIIGTLIGAVSGYYGGLIDDLLMRLTDLVLTLPGLAVLLTASAFLGNGSPFRIAIILALLFWTGLARIVRGNFLSLREKEFVESARAVGAGDLRIIFRHMLPNALGPIVVNMTLIVGVAIITEAALSFLGFGIQPPNPALGKLIAEGQNVSQSMWWLVMFPGMTMLLIVLAINFIGDGLRDALDPSQRRTRA
jgi:peptide/nickel transport system permease protein